MSFGINGPDRTPSIQKSHHANDGGAGNLGYFEQQKKKKDEEEKSDVFEFSSQENDEENPLIIELDNIGTKVKNFWFKLNKSFVEKKSEET